MSSKSRQIFFKTNVAGMSKEKCDEFLNSEKRKISWPVYLLFTEKEAAVSGQLAVSVLYVEIKIKIKIM